MFVGSFLCHQRAERAPHLFGAQFPLCWRCTGILIGSVALVAFTLMRRKLPARRVALPLALLMPLDVFTAALGLWNGHNAARFVTGALWGFFGTTLCLYTLKTLPQVFRFLTSISLSRSGRKSPHAAQATPDAALRL